LQDEGIGSVIVDENTAPQISRRPRPATLELTACGFVVYDMLGRAKPIPWADVALVAAGAVRHYAMTSERKEDTVMRFSVTSGSNPKSIPASSTRWNPILTSSSRFS